MWTRTTPATKWLILLGLGLGYLAFVRITGHGIPCLFRVLTGWQCPGCGITTMLVCLSRGDLFGAFAANPFLLLTLPFLLAEILMEIRRSRRMEPEAGWNRALLAGYLILLCGFGIWRNL